MFRQCYIFRQDGIILKKRMYSGMVVVFGQSGCIQAKVVVCGKSRCIRAKVL